jgi:hypothetical protein
MYTYINIYINKYLYIHIYIYIYTGGGALGTAQEVKAMSLLLGSLIPDDDVYLNVLQCVTKSIQTSQRGISTNKH